MSHFVRIAFLASALLTACSSSPPTDEPAVVSEAPSGTSSAVNEDLRGARESCDAKVALFTTLENNTQQLASESLDVIDGWIRHAEEGQNICLRARMFERATAMRVVEMELRKIRTARLAQLNAVGQNENAGQTFLLRAPEIDTTLNSAELAADKSQWIECASRLDEAQKALDEFRDPSTTNSKAWLDRVAKVAKLRERAKLALDRMKEERHDAEISCSGLHYARARALFDALAAEPGGDEAAITRRVAGDYGVTVESLDRAYLTCVAAGKIP